MNYKELLQSLKDNKMWAELNYTREHLMPITETPDSRTVKRRSSSACSLPKEFDGEFYGVGSMGKIFIKTKCGDTNVLDVRAWGYLTGRGGGLAMDEDLACKTQDQFEAWVIEALNAHRENAEAESHQTENDHEQH